ncbi:MAG: TIGR00730 family Rossman fold protein [Bacteroidetes bacterium]|nr:TIGR00730 family Rossman fold protein [Bacteroidota bacterium]
MKKVCIFCGSSMGKDPIYKEEATKIANYLYEQKIDLVYGGSNVGIMKILADTTLDLGGKAIGVIPQFLMDIEVGHKSLTELHVVDSMQDRKRFLVEISDGFIAFPGGIGTLDELAEILTIAQLRVYDKPLGIYNLNGFFDHLLKFIEHATNEGFIQAAHYNNLIIDDDIERLIQRMQNFKPVQMAHWLKKIKNESSVN